MTFAWPHLLWLLLLPAALFAWELTRHRRIAANTHPKILRAEAGANSLRLSILSAQSSTGRSPRLWLCLGLVFAVVAFARPQWGRVDEPVFDQSREIIIAIDLSRSMLTPDVKPTRLDRAKLLTQSLLEKLAGERVGLVVFSGTAFLQCPLSSDYEIFREFLPALNPSFLPEGGTNYGALIDTALGAFGTSNAADRFLVILSDGEATDDNWRDRAPELKKKGVRVIALGVGTAAGALIPDGSGGLVKDDRGAVVLSKLEPATLRELADLTGGTYRDASAWVDLAGVVNATVEAGRKGQFLEKNTVRLVERFQWPLALALWLLCVSAYYEFPVRPRPREIKLTAPARKPSAATLAGTTLALLCVFALGLAHPLRAAGAAAEPPSTLAKIVGRLSDRSAVSGRDWAEFAGETVRWGQNLQSSQQPVPAGPVNDALAAVNLGSALEPKTADWPKLRQDLEALLQKPEEQKKDEQKNQDQQDKDKQDQQDQNQQQKDQQGGKDKQDQKSSKDQQQQQSQSKDSPSQQKQDQQSQDQQNKDGKSGEPQKKESAFGDMKDKQPPPPKPQPGETQKVGGAPEKQDAAQSADPALAVPLQKLEQLRNEDSPAELFQMMDADRKPAAPKPKSKDW
ncbi:MAG: VWA domain-containing protein [Verrucomicrobia bacterium]|nr:VWA domain-containing protein [Verrucomicrobiota bacterium]